MKIKEVFAKKIDREIQGVIIVGQGEEANVSQELEEYVVTRELQKHLPTFMPHIKRASLEQHRRWEFGFPAFLEVVNLTF